MANPPPRRRHSPAVYRRRRIALILAIAVVVAVVWLLVAQPWRGSAAERPKATPTTSSSSPSPTAQIPPSTEPSPTPTAPSPTSTATPTTTPDASASPTEAPIEACTAGDLTVEGVTDHDAYAADQNPQFSIRLTNRGATDCSLNVGTSAQVFTVTSGTDTWWRSTDCQSEPSDMVVTLSAGQTVTSATPLTWDRTRSAVDSCDSTDRPRAAGGGASYHLAVSIGGVPATQTAMFMLD